VRPLQLSLSEHCVQLCSNLAVDAVRVLTFGGSRPLQTLQAKQQHTLNLELLMRESLLRHDFGALPDILLVLLSNEVRQQWRAPLLQVLVYLAR